jgi:hypothetical protein
MVRDKTGDAVLLDDHEIAPVRDHLLDLDVLVTGSEEEVGAVCSDALVLLEGQREPLEAPARRALADELERRVTTERGGDAQDVLVERPKGGLVLGQAFLAGFAHRANVAPNIAKREQPAGGRESETAARSLVSRLRIGRLTMDLIVLLLIVLLVLALVGGFVLSKLIWIVLIVLLVVLVMRIASGRRV